MASVTSRNTPLSHLAQPITGGLASSQTCEGQSNNLGSPTQVNSPHASHAVVEVVCEHPGPRMALPYPGGPNYHALNPDGPRLTKNFVCVACYVKAVGTSA